MLVGRSILSAIADVETFLIQNALTKNPELSNVQGTKEEKWSITGVIRGGKAKASKATKRISSSNGTGRLARTKSGKWELSGINRRP